MSLFAIFGLGIIELIIILFLVGVPAIVGIVAFMLLVSRGKNDQRPQ
jgi:hypothetical protein